jgi:CubicO group peptidase (beta-lactamase class C family)
MRSIALDQKLSGPITKLDVALYMYGRMLDFTPGTNTKYSNFGYLLASAVVEQVTNMDFFQYLRQAVLQPDGIDEVLVMPTAASKRTSRQAIAEDPGLGASALDPSSSLFVPAVYGGDDQVKEVAAACAGLGAPATAMVQFIHLHAVWGNGGRAPNSARAGSTPGSSTYAWSRGDGVDVAFVINTRTWPPDASTTVVDDLVGRINHLLDTTALP